jgi:methionyl-tRNA synthetase
MLSFAYKRFDSKVPDYYALTLDDVEIVNRVEDGFNEIGAQIEAVRLREALSTAMGLVRDANAYLDKRKPWKTITDDPDDAARSVYTILKVIDNLKILLAPFLPHSAQQLHEYLGYDGQLFGDLKIEEYQEATRAHKGLVYDGSKAIGRWEKSTLKAGRTLREPKPLFVKLEPEIVEKERAYLGAPREEHEIE